MSRSTSSKRRHGAKEGRRGPVITTCVQSGGKLRYRSRKIALGALNCILRDELDLAGKGRGIPTTVYKCQHCSDWHLTSRPVDLR